MKKSLASLVVAAFLFTSVAAAQTPGADTSKASAPAKIVSISGKVSDDGKNFLAKHGESWSIANPEAIAGHIGHELKLKVQVLAASHQIQVLAVKVLATQVRLVANPSDSAFHR
jgi:hypothetical protein